MVIDPYVSLTCEWKKDETTHHIGKQPYTNKKCDKLTHL
jgi:hypothetical protein